MERNNNNNNNNESIPTRNESHSTSLSLLVEAIGSKESGRVATLRMDLPEAEFSNEVGRAVSRPLDRDRSAGTSTNNRAIVAETAIEGRASLGSNEGCIIRQQYNTGERSLERGDSLAMLASAASGSHGSIEKPDSFPGGTSKPAEKSAEQQKKSTKIKKSLLLKTAKSLSNDPLVQLSMLRAMQQQRVVPDPETVEKKKLEREKALALQNAKKKKPPALANRKVQKQYSDSRTLPSRRTGTKQTPFHVNGPEDATSKQALPIPEPQLLARGDVQNSDLSMQLLQLAQGLKEGQLLTPETLAVLLQQQQDVSQGQDVTDSRPRPATHASVVPQVSGPTLANAVVIMQSLLSSMQMNQVQEVPKQQSFTYDQVGPVPMELPKVVGPQGNPSSGEPMTLRKPECGRISDEHAGGSSGRVPIQKEEKLDLAEVLPQMDVRIPCRARGMPSDHNFQTAHFVVPSDVVHGQDLVCSYPACRDSGVKFRFCLHCKIPVAKRNFRLRHSHLDSVQAPPGVEMQVPSTICVASDSTGPSRLSGYGPISRAHSTKDTAENGAAVDTAGLPSDDDMAVVLGDRRRSKKRKHHSKQDSSRKRRKHSSKKRDHFIVSDQNLKDPVPATIQISSESPTPEDQLFAKHALEDTRRKHLPHSGNADVKVSVNFEEPKSSYKHHESKKRKQSHSKRNHSHRSETGDRAVSMDGPKSSDANGTKAFSKSTNLVEDVSHGNAVVGLKKKEYTRSGDKKKAKISKKRLLLWAGLLGERPPKEDEDSMSKWLMSVLAVSDFKAPLKGEPSSSPSSLSLEGFDNVPGGALKNGDRNRVAEYHKAAKERGKVAIHSNATPKAHRG